MSPRHLSSSDDAERGRALKRLQAAIAERNQARRDREAAKGSQGDQQAGASARAADEQATPRKRRLKSAGGNITGS